MADSTAAAAPAGEGGAPRAAAVPHRTKLANTLVHCFPAVLGLYFAVQVARRVIEPQGLGLDEAEQIVMAQAFAWGYGSQPPLYTWLQMAVFKVFGQTVLSLAILKNIVLFLTFLLVFKVAERVLPNRLAAASATLCLFLIPQIAWESQRALVHTPFAVCAAAGTLLALLILIERRRTLDYALLGCTIAVGILAKYGFPVFVGGLIGAALTTPSGCRAVLDRRILLVSLPVVAALTAPTLAWSLANLDLLLSRVWKFGIEREALGPTLWLRGLSSLAADVAAYGALCVLVFAIVAFTPSGRRRLLTTAAETDAEEPVEAMPRRDDRRRIVLATPLFCLAILVIFMLISGSTEFKDRWLQPFLFVLPLACFIILESRLDQSRQLALASCGGFVALAAMVALLATNRLSDLPKRPSRVATPFAAIAAQLRAAGFQEGTIISPDTFISGNLLFQLPQTQAITAEYQRLPIDYAAPVLIAWDDDQLSTADRRSIAVALRAACGAELPEHLQETTFQAPFTGSAVRIYSLKSAVLNSCGESETR